jgi:hypothetical protein
MLAQPLRPIADAIDPERVRRAAQDFQPPDVTGVARTLRCGTRSRDSLWHGPWHDPWAECATGGIPWRSRSSASRSLARSAG